MRMAQKGIGADVLLRLPRFFQEDLDINSCFSLCAFNYFHDADLFIADLLYSLYERFNVS